MRLKRCRQWLFYLLLRIAICIVQSLPIAVCERLAFFASWMVADRLQLRGSVIDENLAMAFPHLGPVERRDLTRRMWCHIVLMIFELAHLPRKIHRTNWRRHIRFESEESQSAYFLDPRPLIVLSGHFGNFEVGGVLTGLMGFPTYSVARPLDNPFLNRFINKFRQATGQFILPKTGSSQLADHILRDGGTLALLGDQSAGPKGCWVEFFGRPASCHKAVALFSLTYQAPLLLCYARRVGKPLQFQLGVAGSYDPAQHGLCDVRHLSQWYSSCLEDLVRSTPAQYWWLHRRWKGAPVRAKRVRKQALPAEGGTREVA
ncbi:MAG: lysophospholipid acyltransferase family protein [Planctomycetota bacterium]|nr:lysophospholipid acyltransferase family protein [Planctomycetota bacterium]